MTILAGEAMPATRAWAGAFLFLFLLVLPFTSSVALRLGFLAFALAFAVAWLSGRGESWRETIPPIRVLLPMLAWGAWGAASAAWSVEPAYSISELRPELLYPFVAFLLFHALTRDLADLDRWAWALCAGLALLCVAAGVQVMAHGTWDPGPWHSDFGAFATHVVLALPLVAWAFLRTRSAWPRALLAVIAAATLVVASWTDNRISWLALAVMTVLAVVLAWGSVARARRARVALVTVLVAAAFVAMFALTLKVRSPLQLASVPGAATELATDPRVAIWRFAAGRIADSPWIGHGFGRGIQREQLRSGLEPGADNHLYVHGHNTLVNVALQGGVVALAVFVWLIAAVVREMAVGLRAGADARLAATLGIVIVAGFAIRNMTDDFLVRHNALLAWSLAGAILGVVGRAGKATSARTPA